GAARRGPVRRSPPARERSLQIGPTLSFGCLERGAGGVDPAGLEDRPGAGGVGRGQVDAVFAHAGGELRERSFSCRGAEAPCAGEVAGPAFLECFLELGLAHSFGRLQSTTAAEQSSPSAGAAGRYAPRPRGQRDSLFLQTGSERREPAGSGGFGRGGGARRGIRSARRAA